MIKTHRFERNPFYVDAVRVREDNLDDLAEWCMGEVRSEESPYGKKTVRYVKVRVFRPKDERQTKAYVGDWILYAGTGYQVYSNHAFQRSFTQVADKEETPMRADAGLG